MQSDANAEPLNHSQRGDPKMYNVRQELEMLKKTEHPMQSPKILNVVGPVSKQIRPAHCKYIHPSSTTLCNKESCAGTVLQKRRGWLHRLPMA